MSARTRPRWNDWGTVIACLVCQIGMGTGGYILPVFLKPVVAELGWSRTLYASSHPITGTVVAIAAPLVGWAAATIGPRIVLISGGLIMGGALVAAGSVYTIPHWYAVAVLIGLGIACLGDLPTGAAIAGRFERNRGLALGMVYIGSNIGGALIPLVATALAVEGSWRQAFVTVGIGLIVLVVPFAAVVSSPDASASKPEEATSSANSAGAILPLSGVLRRSDFWLLFWVIFVFYFYRLGVNTHLVAYLSDLGYSEEAAAGGFSLTLALGIAGKLIAGSIADRIGVRIAVVGNFVLMTLASALLLAPATNVSLPVFLALHGATTAAEDVVVPLLVGRRFGTENLSRVYGLLLLGLVPGGTLGPLAAGAVFDASQSYEGVFAVFFVGNILSLLALIWVVRAPCPSDSEPI